MLIRVQQVEAQGCGVAVVASILGINYEQARKLWGKRYFDQRGMGVPSLDRRLAAAGFGIQRLYKQPGQPWPPKPWAAIHICVVDSTEKHPAGGKDHHFVIMDSKGWVTDPVWEGTWGLHDYAYVHNVAAIFRTPRDYR